MEKKSDQQQTETVQSQKKVFKKVPGQKDFPPADFKDYEHLRNGIEELALSFGFEKSETATFEADHLLTHRSYFPGEPLEYSTPENIKAVLRPSVLPGLLRMYSQISEPDTEDMFKWYYITPIFYQQHNPYQLISDIEYGFTIIGDDSAVADAQQLAIGWKLYSQLGEGMVVLEVGSRGCEQCWPEYKKTLISALSENKYNLCRDCAMDVEENPEKVLTCEQPECQALAAEAPPYFDYLDEACSQHLTDVLESLEELRVPYVLVPVAGHPHPVHRTYFRFKFNSSTDTFYLSNSHRRDFLMKQYVEEEQMRPVLAMTGHMSALVRAFHLAGDSEVAGHRQANVVVIPLGDLAAKKSLPLFSMLWDEGIKVNNFIGENSLKVRLQQAADHKIPLALVIGQQEALDDTVILRDVKSGMQEVFPLERILDEVKKRLGE